MKFDKFPLHALRIDLQIHVDESFSLKMRRNAFAKSIDSGQFAQSTQAGLGLYSSATFKHIVDLFSRRFANLNVK